MRVSRARLPLCLCLVPYALSLAACLPVTRPVVKIGLVAPFEGRYRDVGYEVIYAVRLAVREANARGGIAGYSVELLALDDAGAPELAREQARKITVDPQIVGVVGHWLESTTLAAASAYETAAIPFLATAAAPDLPASAFRVWPTDAALRAALPGALYCPAPCDSLEDLEWLISRRSSGVPPQFRRPAAVQASNLHLAGPPLWGQPQFALLAGAAAEGVYFVAPAPLPAQSADPGFADRYRALSNGVEPRSNAVLAYDAAQILFEAIARDVAHSGAPSRAGVAAALSQTDFSGLSGRFSFDARRSWSQAKGWVYQWRNGLAVIP